MYILKIFVYTLITEVKEIVLKLIKTLETPIISTNLTLVKFSFFSVNKKKQTYLILIFLQSNAYKLGYSFRFILQVFQSKKKYCFKIP